MDPLGNYVIQSFDAIGELVQQVYYDSNATALATSGFFYEPGGLVSYATNALGGISHKNYTTAGQVTSAEYADGSSEQWNYDLAGRITLHTVRKGSGYWTTDYDDANRRVSNVFHRADRGASLATNSVQLDRRGNTIQRIDELGNVFTNLFDGLDRIKIAAGPPIVTVGLSADLKTYDTNVVQQISTYAYDNCGKVLTISNALGERTVTSSDPLGRPLQVAYYNANGATPVRVVSTGYSPDHNSVTVTNGTGANAIVATTYTDTAGHPVLTLHYPTNGIIEYSWQQFDANGNRLASQQLSSGGTVTTWATNRWTYDGLNRVVNEVTKDGAVTSYGYDSMGDVTSRTMPGGLSWSATYNNAGQITYEEDSGGGETNRQFAYDYYPPGPCFAGALWVVSSDMWEPGNIGWLSFRTSSYDFWGRPSSITTASFEPGRNSLTTCQYDLRGFATNITQSFSDPNTGPETTVLRGFDAYGRIVSEQTLLDGQALSGVSQTWDSAGRRTALNCGSMGIGFGYQADGLMTAAGNSVFGYANNGLLLGRTNASRTYSINQRDGEGRMLQSSTRVLGQSQLVENLNWRNDGRLNSYTAARGDFTNSCGYSYSPLAQRLTQESFYVGSGLPVTNTYTLDGGQTGGLGLLSSRTAAGNSTAAWSAVSLEAGNRLAVEQSSYIRRPAYGLAAGAGQVSATLDDKPLSVQFDGSDGGGQWRADMDAGPGSHTLRVSAVDPSGLYFGSATNAFACATNSGDSVQNSFYVDGSVAQRAWVNSLGQVTRFQTLTWDYYGHIIGMVDRDTQYNGYIWSAVYDGLGRRARTICTMVVSNTPVSTLDASNQVSEVDSWYDPQVEFLEVGVKVDHTFSMKTYGPDANGIYGGMQGVGGLEAINTYGHTSATGVVQDYFGNVLGTIASGAVTWNPARFSSYGPVPGYQQSTLSLNTPLAQSLGWRGKRVDETGFINLGARVYDPVSGRFISADPLGHAASQDLYSFCGGDPVNRFDPDGRCIDQGMQGVENWASSKYQNAVNAWGEFSNPETRGQANLDYTYGQVQGAVQWTTETLGALAKAVRGNPMQDYLDQLNPYPSVSDRINGWMNSTATGYGINPNSASAQTGNFGSQAGLTVASLLVGPGEARAGSEFERLLPSVEQMTAAEGTRALQLPATRGMAPGVLGETLPNGQVFLSPGLSRAEQVSTLRHESVHAFFSPEGSGPIATFRQNLGQWGYDNSQLLRFTEEAMAETYGSGSLLQGLRHPLVNGYGITPGGLLFEGGVVGGGIFGAGYLGYQIGGGN